MAVLTGRRRGEILLVADLFEPLDDLTVERFLNGDVAHAGRGGAAMPVFLARRTHHHIAGADLAFRPVPALHPAAATVCSLKRYQPLTMSTETAPQHRRLSICDHNFDPLVADSCAKIFRTTGALTSVALDAPDLARQVIRENRWPLEVNYTATSALADSRTPLTN